MKKTLRLFLIGCILSFCTSLFAAEAPHFKRIIVFGDSYSDNGNVFKLTAGKYPNATRYFQGRFSDGPVWVEYFAKNFDLDPHDTNQFIDLGFGQAKVLNPAQITVLGQPNQTYSIPAFSQQIDAYLKQYQHFTANDLIIVFISTNDFFDLPQNDASAFITLADQESAQIDRLISQGATHLIVLNGRNVTYAPLATLIAEKNAHDKQAITAYLNHFQTLIEQYNTELALKLKDKPGVFLYNIYEFDRAIIEDIKKQGFAYTMDKKSFIFKNATDGCYQNNQGDYQLIAGAVCSHPENYFFYDRIHTTHFVNYLLAQNVYHQYSNHHQ